MSSIAVAQSKAGDVAGSRQTFAMALRTARSFKDDRLSKSWALHVIAPAQAEAGDVAGSRRTFAEALRTARSIKSKAGKDYVTGNIISGQAFIGDFAAALQTVKTIKHDAEKILCTGRHRHRAGPGG